MQRFSDRTDAARQLLKSLGKYRNRSDAIVIAIPRGGLKIGSEIAKSLSLPLDVFFAKKIGHPESSELAIGVVGIEKEIIDATLIKEEGIHREYIENEIKRIRKSLISKEQLYHKGLKSHSLKNKLVIITDDGIATGSTVLLTIRLIKSLQPKKIVVAVPVGPFHVKRLLEQEVDEVIFLQDPEHFSAISEFYQNFEPIEDEEAIHLLQRYTETT